MQYAHEISKNNDNNAPRHPIRIVTRRTGLKPDLIRAWERRYEAVKPKRSATGRRLYSDADIERLQLLRKAVRAGRGIRLVASLSNQELLQLIDDDIQGAVAFAPVTRLSNGDANQLVADITKSCLEAIMNLDDRAFHMHLERASVALSRMDLLERLLVPLMEKIGNQWRMGTLRPVHEHLASAVIRSFVGNLQYSELQPEGAPNLIVTTPARQRHELGALVASICAASEGWQVTFLGSDLPMEEIAAGAHQKKSRAVLLSVTFPPDDPALGQDLERLRRLLPPQVSILIGGRSADNYRTTFEKIGAKHLKNLVQLREELRSIRA